MSALAANAKVTSTGALVEKEKQDAQRLASLKSFLRLLSELVSVGIAAPQFVVQSEFYANATPFEKATMQKRGGILQLFLSMLVRGDEVEHHNAPVISYFAKHECGTILKTVPKRVRAGSHLTPPLI